MNHLIHIIETYLLPIATKVGDNKLLRSISNAFMSLMPVIIAGAIFTLLANLNIEVYQSFILSIGLKQIFAFIPNVTSNMLAIYAAFFVAYEYTKQLKLQRFQLIAGATSLVVFLLMIPLGVTATEGEVTITVAAALSTSWLGAGGLFSAMIIGLIVPAIFYFFDTKHIEIKMPDGVPPMISNSFSAIMPVLLIVFLFAIARYLFTLTSYGDLNNMIYSILRMPLAKLGGSPFTWVVLTLMCCFLWFFGIQGGMVINPFLVMLYQAATLENLAAYAAGDPLPNKIIMSCWLGYTSVGGAGGTLGLCLIMFFLAKSKRYKTLGKIALPAGCCGINEPIIFGAPVVLNPILLIPFLLTPVLTFTLSYILTNLQVLPILYGTDIAMGTPVILSGLLAGGQRVAIWQVGIILIQMVIYYPFFKVLDRQACKEEINTVEETGTRS